MYNKSERTSQQLCWLRLIVRVMNMHTMSSVVYFRNIVLFYSLASKFEQILEQIVLSRDIGSVKVIPPS